MNEWVWSIGVMMKDAMKVFESKPVPLSLCPPYIPHELSWGQTWTSMLRDHKPEIWQGIGIKN
jgi:hypothetical protein